LCELAVRSDANLEIEEFYVIEIAWNGQEDVIAQKERQRADDADIGSHHRDPAGAGERWILLGRSEREVG
jgi:hypothetical protein